MGAPASVARASPARSMSEAVVSHVQVGRAEPSVMEASASCWTAPALPGGLHRARATLSVAAMSLERAERRRQRGQHHRVGPWSPGRGAAAPAPAPGRRSRPTPGRLSRRDQRAALDAPAHAARRRRSAGSWASAWSSSDSERSSRPPGRRRRAARVASSAWSSPVRCSASGTRGQISSARSRCRCASAGANVVRACRAASIGGGQRTRQVQGGVPVVGEGGGQRRVVAGQLRARSAPRRRRRARRTALAGQHVLVDGVPGQRVPERVAAAGVVNDEQVVSTASRSAA